MSADAKPASLLRPLVQELHERRAAARRGGGAEKADRQHEQGKLTARERIALLVDDGTFTELGIHAQPHFSQRAMEGREAPADGVITGYGRVDGRPVAVCAYDFTVKGGSIGMTGETKVTRLRELALRKPHADGLVHRLGRRAHRPSEDAIGSLFAGDRLPVPRGGGR